MFLTRHQPNSLFDQLSDDLFRVFDRPSTSSVNRSGLQTPSQHTMHKKLQNTLQNKLEHRLEESSAWAPRVDILEKNNQYIILADVPGVDPKSIEITTDKNILTISGKREPLEDVVDNAYQRTECTRGSFSRRFTMPEDVNSNKISAKSKNGVLEVIVPRYEQELPRKINVNT